MKRIMAAVGVILAILFAQLPTRSILFAQFPTTSIPFLYAVSEASNVMLGRNARSDVAQDFYGFQAMVRHKDPYAVLGRALRTIGVRWDLDHASTHPPTAFLIVAPVAWLPWPLSSVAWAWLMMAALLASFHATGYSWKTSILLMALAILWPPTSHSLYQITIVWLLGIMLAYQFQSSKPMLAGVFIGLASLTKFLPVIMLVPFIVRRNWKALWGFALSWLVAVAAILLIAPNAFRRYLKVNETTTITTFMRQDNSSPVALLVNHRFGPLEIGLALLLFAVLVIVTVRLLRQKARTASISFAEWSFYSYLCVLLLPILWIYSILPLLPILIRLTTNGKVPAVLATAAILIPFVTPPFSNDTKLFLFPFLLLSGAAVVASLISEFNANSRQTDRESREASSVTQPGLLP